MIKVWLILGICSTILNIHYKIQKDGALMNNEGQEFEAFKKMFFQIIGGGLSFIYVLTIWWKEIAIDSNKAMKFLRNQF